MARIRSLKPDFFTSEQVASLPFEWRLLFQGLWCHADRDGRLLDRPQRLKAMVFPYDNLNVGDGLDRLASAGLIVRYQVGGERLIAIPTWLKHQQPNAKEKASALPAPPIDGEHGTSTVPAPQEGKGTGTGTDQERYVCAEPLRDSTPATALLSFPVVGPGPKTWDLLPADVAEWETLFPALDVLADARNALAWILAKPTRRKTARGMKAFLVNWFSRTVNSPHFQAKTPAVPASPAWTPCGQCAWGWRLNPDKSWYLVDGVRVRCACWLRRPA